MAIRACLVNLIGRCVGCMWFVVQRAFIDLISWKNYIYDLLWGLFRSIWKLAYIDIPLFVNYVISVYINFFLSFRRFCASMRMVINSTYYFSSLGRCFISFDTCMIDGQWSTDRHINIRQRIYCQKDEISNKYRWHNKNLCCAKQINPRSYLT